MSAGQARSKEASKYQSTDYSPMQARRRAGSIRTAAKRKTGQPLVGPACFLWGKKPISQQVPVQIWR